MPNTLDRTGRPVAATSVPFAKPRHLLRWLVIAAACVFVLTVFGSVWLPYQGRHGGVPIRRVAAHHLEVLIDGQPASRINGKDIAAIGVIADQALVVYVVSGSAADVALHSLGSETSSEHPQATLLLDGNAIARGYVAADYNVVDSQMGPAPGETGFFYRGADSYPIFWRIIGTLW